MKEVFFRMILSVLFTEGNGEMSLSRMLQLFLVLNHCDNMNVFFGGPFKWYVTHAVFGVIAGLATLLGYRPYYDEYLPPRLRSLAKSGGEGRAR